MGLKVPDSNRPPGSFRPRFVSVVSAAGQSRRSLGPGCQWSWTAWPSIRSEWWGALDGSWRRRFAEVALVGWRIAGEVIAVDLDAGQVRLSMAATENPWL